VVPSQQPRTDTIAPPDEPSAATLDPSISSPFLLLDVAADNLGDVGVFFLALFDEGGIVEALVIGLDLILRFGRLTWLLLALRFRVGISQGDELVLLGFSHNRLDLAHRRARLDQRIHNGTKPTILTPEALAALKERIKTPPEDGRLWSGPKIARWLAKFHGVRSVHDQRGWDALIAIGYSIQQPRPRHPDAATGKDRAALKKSLRPRLTRSGVNTRARALKSRRWMKIASA
jgi:winged helix-turn-helix protein